VDGSLGAWKGPAAMSTATSIRALVGLLGALILVVADIVASPAGATGAEVWAEGVTLLAERDATVTMIAAGLSPLGAAFALVGCLATYETLRPAGRGVAAVAAGGFAQWFVGYAAYAGGRPLIGVLAALVESVEEGAALTQAVTFLNVHRALGGVGLFFGSMFFFFTVLFRAPSLPRSAVAMTPILWMPLVRLTPLLPAGGGAYWFSFINVVWVGYFAALAVNAWKRRTPDPGAQARARTPAATPQA